MNQWPTSFVNQSAKSDPVPHLSRKEVVKEAIHAQNRVLKLKIASEKALRLAEKAKREEHQVLKWKIHAVQLEEKKHSWKQEQKNKLQESKVHLQEIRKRSQLERQEVREALLKYKREETNAIKKQSEAILKFKKKSEEYERDEMAERVNSIKYDETIRKFRKQLYFERRLQYYKIADSDVQKQHMAKINDHINEMRNLEHIESDLIQQMNKNLQVRDEAHKNIEKIMRATPEDLLQRSFLKVPTDQSTTIDPKSFLSQPGTPFRRSFVSFSRKESPELFKISKRKLSPT